MCCLTAIREGFWVRALVRNSPGIYLDNSIVVYADDNKSDRLGSVKDICDDIFLGEATQDNTLDGLCDNIHTGNTHLPSVLDRVSSCVFTRSKNCLSLSYVLGSRLAGEFLLPSPHSLITVIRQT